MMQTSRQISRRSWLRPSLQSSFKMAWVPLCAAIVLGTALVARADPPNVGDRVQVERANWTFAHVKEVGTGSNAGFYLLTYDNHDFVDGWWYDYKKPGRIFQVDASGKRIKDYYTRPGDPAPTNPGAVSQNFKVGDRVEVYDGVGKWEPGTVTSPLESNRYLVAMDKFVGKGIPPSHAMPQEVRAPQQATKAPTIPKFPAKRPPIAEPAQGTAKPGRPPFDLTKKLIQYSWEEQTDSTTTVNCDVLSLVIGGTRHWVINRDIGPADPNTPVYTAKARLTRRTYYSGHVVIVENDILYKVYIDTFGKWHVGADEIKDTKPLESISYQ